MQTVQRDDAQGLTSCNRHAEVLTSEFMTKTFCYDQYKPTGENSVNSVVRLHQWFSTGVPQTLKVW